MRRTSLLILTILFFPGKSFAGKTSKEKFIRAADSIVESYWGKGSVNDYIRINDVLSSVEYSTSSGTNESGQLNYFEWDSRLKIKAVHFGYTIRHESFITKVYLPASNSYLHVYAQFIRFSLDSAGRLIPGENSGLTTMPGPWFVLFPNEKTALDSVAVIDPLIATRNDTCTLAWWTFPSVTGKDSISAAGIIQGRFVYKISFPPDPNVPDKNPDHRAYMNREYYVDCVTGKVLAKTDENKVVYFSK